MSYSSIARLVTKITVRIQGSKFSKFSENNAYFALLFLLIFSEYHFYIYDRLFLKNTRFKDAQRLSFFLGLKVNSNLITFIDLCITFVDGSQTQHKQANTHTFHFQQLHKGV
jgi:hypothetical protein